MKLERCADAHAVGERRSVECVNDVPAVGAAMRRMRDDQKMGTCLKRMNWKVEKGEKLNDAGVCVCVLAVMTQNVP